MPAYLFDILIVALLAFFAWRGASKGLILSLCGLAAVFVAFFAAQFLSDLFYKPVANILRPVIVQAVQEVAPTPAVTADPTLPGYTLDELMDSITENGLFEGFTDFLEQGMEDDGVQFDILHPLDSLAVYLSQGIAKALLFGIIFIAVLLAWFLISHALDLAFHLPILSTVNTGGGLAIGLVKGVLTVIVLVWLGQLAGWVPSQPATPVLSLFTVQGLSRLLSGLAG